jgi:co-chaperonin GroES (HSP10)
MENRINIAELLKDCPTGMELDCLMYDNVTLDHVSIDGDYPIKIVTQNGFSTKLTKYGQNVSIGEAKCVIFPKGKTTWEGFVPPCKFKDGDIVAHQNHMGTWIGIYHKHDYLNETFSSYCCIGRDGKFWAYFNNDHGYDKTRLATKEEKAKLFQAIKDNGYKWNAETKTLEKLVVPEFKVGDKITNGKTSITIGYIDDEYYYEMGRNVANRLFIKNQDDWELVPDKFDISTLKPFDSRVLVRDYSYEPWRVSFWGCLLDNKLSFKYDTIRGYYKQCIPYEGNEYLLGKTEECKDFYKTW